jgi:hypothetical protein
LLKCLGHGVVCWQGTQIRRKGWGALADNN